MRKQDMTLSRMKTHDDAINSMKQKSQRLFTINFIPVLKMLLTITFEKEWLLIGHLRISSMLCSKQNSCGFFRSYILLTKIVNGKP